MGFFDNLTRKNESVRIKKNSDDENNLYYNVDKNNDTINDSNNDLLNMNEINKFRLLKSNRNEKFNSFDLMAQDSRVASILNMYADDCTQYNQSSKIIWAESSDQNCANFVNRLIDNLQLNKHAWSHIYSLCKYGDLYLELFYDEERVNDLNGSNSYFRPNGSTITEHIEMVRNPGGMFDLTSHGKTSFYVKVNSNEENYEAISQGMQIYQNSSRPEDNCLYPPDKYIHISLNDAYSRFSNKYVLQNTETGEDEEFDIKEGTSILANAFKTWSELNLLEDSVLLNRLSKSAIIRLIQIEVGNTEGEDVQEVLKSLRDKISRSRYFDKSTGDFKNQANPGPLENIIYHATHKGNGAITHSTIGGDVNVRDLADIDYFLEKFAQSFPIPLAYLKQCLRGNTNITLLNGQTKTIKYLYDNKNDYIGKGILTCSPEGNISATKIVDIALTRKNTKFIRIYLDNDEFVDTTPDHKFMMRDGSFKEAQFLQENDSLMPLYSKYKCGRKYIQLNNKRSDWVPQYRLVGEAKYNTIPKKHQIHHIDSIKANDDFDNLQLLSLEEHSCLHGHKSIKKIIKQRELDKLNMSEEEYHLKYGAGGRAVKGIPKSEEYKKLMSKLLKGRKKSKEAIEKRTISYMNNFNNNEELRLKNYNSLIKARSVNQEKLLLKKNKNGKYINVKCFNCGKVMLNYYLKNDDVNKYLNKEKLIYCCRDCSNKNSKINRTLKQLINSNYDKDIYSNNINHLTKAFYYQIHELDKFYKIMDNYDPMVINHKVKKIEYLTDIVEDAYDITVESNNHTFALTAGIFIHNCNDDGGGLSAGTSLTKFDAKYGRTLKRIQSAYISGIIDLINVYAYKKGLSDYMNSFTIKMVSPSAVEDNERDEKLKNHTDMIRDIMQVVNDQDDAYKPETKKKMIAYLAQSLLQDQGLTDILQEDLNEDENKPNYSSNENNEEDELL